jgi:hypothetical protein
MHTAESHKLSVATTQRPGTPDDVPSDLAIDTATNALIRDPFSVSDLPPFLPMDLVTVDREDRWHDVIQIDEYAERGMVRPIDSQDDREDRWIDFVRLHKIDPVDCVELLSDPPPVPGDPQVLLSCWVDGTPRPKGSLKPTGRQGGRVRLVEQSTDSSTWRDTIAWTARRELNLPAPGYPTQLPVELACTFAFERAESCTDEEPTGAGIGDTDKLIRNVMDALQDAKVYRQRPSGGCGEGVESLDRGRAEAGRADHREGSAVSDIWRRSTRCDGGMCVEVRGRHRRHRRPAATAAARNSATPARSSTSPVTNWTRSPRAGWTENSHEWPGSTRHAGQGDPAPGVRSRRPA